MAVSKNTHGFDDGTRVALVGAGGMLARMVRAVAPINVEIIPYDFPAFDIADLNAVSEYLHQSKPAFIINCAAVTDVDGCESNVEQAMAVNGLGPSNLAAVAAQIKATLLHVSTDFVFSGSSELSYVETDQPAPLSVYGDSKYNGEIGVETSALRSYFIVRTSWLYGPWGKNFVETIIRLAQERERLSIVADQKGTPTYSFDLACTIWELLQTSCYGVYHYSNEGQCSWYEFALEIVHLLRQFEAGGDLKVREIVPVSSSEYPQAAQRPVWSVMSKEKIRSTLGNEVPHWKESLKNYILSRHDHIVE